MARKIEMGQLFWQLEMEAKGVDESIAKAQTSLLNLTNFIIKNPTAATVGLGTALVALALQASQKAEEIDKDFTKIGASLPDAIGKTDELRDSVRDLSLQFGVGQKEVSGMFVEIAKGGVESTADLNSLAQAALIAAKAVGGDFKQIAIDTGDVLDVFGLSAADASAVLSKLFVVAQGKTSLDAMLLVMKELAPTMRQTGLSFNDTAAAVATLIDRGFTTAKMIKGELVRVINEEGLPGLKKLAAQSKVTSDGVREMGEAFQRASDTSEHAAATINARISAAFISLGQTVKPVIASLAETLADLLARIDSASYRTRQALQGLLKGAGESSFAMLQFGVNLRNVTNQLKEGNDVLEGLNVAQLDQLAGALGRYATRAKATKEVTPLLEAIKERTNELAAAATKSKSALEQGSKALNGLSAAQRAAVESSQKLTDEQKATLLATGAVSDELKKHLSTAMKEYADRTKDAAKEAEKLRAKNATMFAESTLTLIDDTALAIKKYTEEAKKAGLSKSEIDTVTKHMETLGKAAERVRLNAVLMNDALVDPDTASQLDRVTDALNKSSAYVLTLEAGTKEHAEAEASVNALLKTQGQLTDKIKLARAGIIRQFAGQEIAVADVLTATKDELIATNGLTAEAADQLIAYRAILDTKESEADTTDKLLRQTASIAIGAIGVARAFGIVNDEASSVLQNVVNIGENITKAFAGDPTAIVGVLGSLAGVLGTIFGGTSPEEQERRDILRKNTDALQDNARRLGDLLRLNTAGAQFAGIQESIQQAFSTASQFEGKFASDKITKALRAALLERGLTFTDLESLAKDLGVELPKTAGAFDVRGLQQLLTIIGSTEFSTFGDTFADQMEKVRAFLETGILEPGQEFAATIRALGDIRGGFPSAIREALTGKDVTTAEGRTAATEALQNLLAGISSLRPEEFGGLTGSEFTQTLVKLIDLLRSDAAITEGLPTGADRTEPPASATQLDASLTSVLGPGSPSYDLLGQLVANTSEGFTRSLADFLGDQSPSIGLLGRIATQTDTDLDGALDTVLGGQSPTVSLLAAIAENTKRFKPIEAPNLRLPQLGGTGTGLRQFQVGQLTIQVVAGGATSPSELGRQVADSFSSALLAREVLLTREARGDATRSLQ